MENNNYILGVDLGITSVGFAIIDKNTLEIIKYGVRLFEESDASNNLKRRTKRGQRRLLRRRSNRIIEMKRLLFANVINKDEFSVMSNVYELRVRGTKAKISTNELANALLHIAKKRGSSLEVAIDENDKENQKLYGSLTANTRSLKEKNCFICDLQLERLNKNGYVKGSDNVFRTIDYIDETKKILSNQGLSEELNERIIDLISRRRHFADGPGDENSPTPYGRFKGEYDEAGNKIIHNLIDDMRGKCSIYEDELRMAKMSFSSCLFNLLNDLNNLVIIDDNSFRKITKEEKETIIQKVKDKGSVSINEICKVLKTKLEGISGYRIDKKGKPEITKFEGYSKFLKLANETNEMDIKNIDFVDDGVEVLTKTQVIEERKTEIGRIIESNKLNISNDSLAKICNFSRINGYHSLSKKAILEINKEMLEEPVNQQQVISASSLGSKQSYAGQKNITFDNSLILSPVAKRAHREAIKVINELRETYGEFDSVVIETTRAKNSADERDEIKKQQEYHESQKKAALELANENNVSIDQLNGIKKLKLRLYKEQQGKCIYTGNPIDLNVLLNDDSAYQIEHIIPYAISFDNSLNNKALAESKANYIKGRRTPFAYFKSGKAYGAITNFEAYKAFVDSLNIPSFKKNNLTTEEDYSKFDNMEKFVARNLIDTSYAIKSMMDTLKKYYSDNNISTKVKTVKGKQTNTFRNIGHIDKDGIKDRNYYIHHAIDALIIAALSTNKAMDKAFNQNSQIVVESTGEVIDSPMEDSNIRKFLHELQLLNNDNKIKTNPFAFSYKVDTKIGRQIADETIYSTRNVDGKDLVVKKYKDIYGANGASVTNMFASGKDTQLLAYKNDIKSYEILKKIYEEYKDVTDNKGKPVKNVFEYYYQLTGEKIRKYSKNNNGPVIDNLKYFDGELGNNINITPTNAKNKKVVLLQISPYRTDIYQDNNGTYKFLTVRRCHIIERNGKHIIPNETYQSLKDLKGIDSNYHFLFSLNRNSIVLIEDKNGKNLFRFLVTNDDSNNVIECKSIANNMLNEDGKAVRIIKTISKNTILIEKYNISPTGIMSKVEKEDLKLSF